MLSTRHGMSIPHRHPERQCRVVALQGWSLTSAAATTTIITTTTFFPCPISPSSSCVSLSV